MSRVKVSKNLYRGRRVRSTDELYTLTINSRSVAWLRRDGSYLVRPAYFFFNWGEDTQRERLGELYLTSEYPTFFAFLRGKLRKVWNDRKDYLSLFLQQ